MIERAEIRNFQSLRSIDLDFGRYTVIVGPSSSGKTALMRALRAVASNVRGTHVITRGTTRMAVTVYTGDHKVTLERDSAAGKYRLVTAGKPNEETYTKLAGAVPADITAALRIDPVPVNGTSTNFANQFDPPYLLGESGANVARTLGTLTNVTAILEAAREANRRRNAAAADLRTRETDLARIVEQAQGYRTLGPRREAVERAERLYDAAATLQSRITRVRAAVEALEVAATVLAQSTPAAVPDTTAFTAAYSRWSLGKELLRTWSAADQQVRTTADVRAQTAAAAEHAEDAIHQQLLAAGFCPTCQQPIAATEAPRSTR